MRFKPLDSDIVDISEVICCVLVSVDKVHNQCVRDFSCITFNENVGVIEVASVAQFRIFHIYPLSVLWCMFLTMIV